MKATRLTIAILLALSLLLSPAATLAQAPTQEIIQSSPPTSTQLAAVDWCVAGDFNTWNNSANPMFDDGSNGDLLPGDGIYSLSILTATAGTYSWKAVECGTWNSHPAYNSWYTTSTADQTVTLTLDTNDYSANAGMALLPASNIVNVTGDDLPTSFTAVGDFQGWNNSDPNTLMDDMGNGFYRLVYTIPAAGSYIGKATTTGSWNSFGADGRSVNAGNISFTTTEANQQMVFLLDAFSGRMLIEPVLTSTGPWHVAGDFNSWNNASTPLFDDGTNGDLLGGDGVFSLDINIPTAGRYEWKVTNGTWDITYPSDNSWLITTEDNQVVKLSFDTNDHSADAGLQMVPNVNILNAWDSTDDFTIVGSFQGWNNANPATVLSPLGRDLYMLEAPIATAGDHEYKVVATGSWDGIGLDNRSVNATNIPLTTYTDGDVVPFLLDYRTGRVGAFPPHAGGPVEPGHDNEVWWDFLGHDSRDTLYRNPGGPVTTNIAVTLRLRAAANDLTEAKLRLYNDRTDTQSILPMSVAYSDGTYDWWEATVPASPDPTVWWYRFIAIDGTDTDYYEDDAAKTGGWGQAFDETEDFSYQLTVYAPDFETPDWIKNAIVYQVFPDRFRDGDPTNNKPAGTFFYGEEGGTVYRSDTEVWNTYICDPRADTNDACEGSYSKNFYGGDLVGLTEKLDYLQALGVDTIYLNPIFESPSNHGYDTTDYLSINEMFGDEADYAALIAGLDTRGMHLIVDGVFNHVSSDSKYLDRYGRYPEVGACESQDSIYRDWFYFTDVPAGTGPCVGSDGTANSANYESWWGYDSLPKLNSTNPEVRAWIWDNQDNPETTVAGHWMLTADGWRLDVGADVDPGTLNDTTNDYWEGFRNTVKTVNPDGYITGEEWGIANSWLLGGEWDAVMNYQFSSAVLSLWRDSAFTDNDHNAGSSAGELRPLSMSQFDERILNLQERYAPEALAAMMNLFGSHDTNRALFMLDENTNTLQPADYLNPDYDWDPAIEKLKGAVMVQMTMPGAPTIYYGDEVGLVGPVAKDGSGVWQDDPYNRQPYPWLDESGTPFYTRLQSQAEQDYVYDYYAALTAARSSYPALRTGDYRTLLIDDSLLLYAYGRNLPGEDSAVILINRDADNAQSVDIDVLGYLPIGTTYSDVLSSATYTVNSEGKLASVSAPANGGAVLVRTNTQAIPPAQILDLAAVANGTTVNLTWSAAANADQYLVYRSYLSGGTFELLGMTSTTSWADHNLVSGQRVYYKVIALDTTTGLTSTSNEVSALPAYNIDWANLQWPFTISHTIGTTPTENIYGQVYISGVTQAPGATPGLLAQIGYGPDGSDPRENTAWTWSDAPFFSQEGNNDQFAGTLIPETIGDFDFLYRYSTNGGLNWVYAYEGGLVSDTYTAANAGDLTVLASSDTTAPSAPVLAIDDWSASSISLSWAAATDDVAVYAYDLYRSTDGITFSKIDRVLAPELSYTDTTVVTNQLYYYYLLALDTSFNPSLPSNTVSQIAEAKLVAVTFEITVPAWTPGTVYIVGGNPAVGDWNPGSVAMTKVSDTLWTYTANILDGSSFEFKLTRGNWDTVMKGADGNEELANLPITVNYGSDGTQTYTYTVQNWRDPVVIAVVPVNEAVGRRPDTSVLVTWSQQMPATTCLVLEDEAGDPVAGTCTVDAAGTQVTFDPTDDLVPGETYTVNVTGQPDVANDQQMVPFISTFTVTTAPILSYSNLTSTSVELTWTEITSPDVAFHRVFRSTDGVNFELVAELTPQDFTWTDTSLLGGRTYWYQVKAACASCASIVDSNIVELTTPARLIETTFTAIVPEWTPGEVYLAYRETESDPWNYTAFLLTKMSPVEWEWNGTLPEGSQFDVMVSRGSAETEMRDEDGNAELSLDSYEIEFGETGMIQIVKLVPNWRDPILLSVSPAAGAQNVALDSVITIRWSQAMPASSCPRVWSTASGLDIAGVCSFDAETNTTTFTPDEPLPAAAHIVIEAAGLEDIVGDLQVVPSQTFFRTKDMVIFLPLILK
jgi:glycosidase